MAGGRIFKNPLKSFSIMVMIVYVRYSSIFIIYTARDRLRLSVIGSDQKGNMLTHIPLHSCCCCCAHFFRSRLLCVRLLFNKWRRHESLASNSLFFPYILSFLPHLMRFKFNKKSMRCGIWPDVYVICIHPKKKKKKEKKFFFSCGYNMLPFIGDSIVVAFLPSSTPRYRTFFLSFLPPPFQL